MELHDEDPNKIIHPWEVAYKLWKDKDPVRYSTYAFANLHLKKITPETLPRIIKIGTTFGQRLFLLIFLHALAIGIAYFFSHSYGHDLQRILHHFLGLTVVAFIEIFLIVMAWNLYLDTVPDLCITKEGLQIKDSKSRFLQSFTWAQIALTEIIVTSTSSKDVKHQLFVTFHKETELKDLDIKLLFSKTPQEIAAYIEGYKKLWSDEEGLYR